MAVYEIPTTVESPAYEQQSELDGELYTLELLWNERDAAWYLSVGDIAGALIASGIKLVPNWPLLRKVVDARRPAGEIMALDTTGEGLTRDNLGSAVRLIYIDAESVAEVLGG